MTRVFVFTNHKGGVGKSTSATNIAFGMVARRCVLRLGFGEVFPNLYYL